jgi:hypothetical protein
MDATMQTVEDSPAETAAPTVSAGGVEALFERMQAMLDAAQTENSRLAQMNQDMLDQMLDMRDRANAAPIEAETKREVDISTADGNVAAIWANRTSTEAARAGVRERVRCVDGWFVPNALAG